MIVTKSDGSKVAFDALKIRKWIKWSVDGQFNQEKMEYEILQKTLEKLPDNVTTKDIHETIIKVCLEKEDINYSRVASNLEMATILKNQQRLLGLHKPQNATFFDFLELMEDKGLWSGNWLTDELNDHLEEIEQWYIELESYPLEFWTVKQWSDKYSVKINGEAIETPAQGALAVALGYHGVTDEAYQLAKNIILGKTNLPTPALNGVRNGDYNSISCCVIHGGDTIASIDAAKHVASSMTAKKAGIGIFMETRSKGDDVKGGAVKHLGKQPIFKAIEADVKMYTQITRGGSATNTIRAIDPDIMEMLMYKTQKIDLLQRVDKIDYEFNFNDAFVKAIVKDDDWYLFSKYWAQEVHDAFHYEIEDYEYVVKQALANGKPHKKVKAREILELFADARWETGRVYCFNATAANRHTPFNGIIYQSNLCMEIFLPTKPFTDMEDLYSLNSNGEVAFCALAAINAEKTEDEEYFEVAENALRTVDRMITEAPGLTKGLKQKMDARRSIGIGVTGLAGRLYKEGLDFDGSQESIEFVQHLVELHYYALLKASIKMSEETGIVVEGVDFDWLPIDTGMLATSTTLDWESLRGKPRMHSVLVAHMPTESSAVFSGATNGVYPSRDRVIYKQARKGKIQFISQYFDPDKHLTAWEVDMIPYYQVIQAFTDQGISADHFTDFSKYPNKRVPLDEVIKWFVRMNAAGIKSAYYQNFKTTDSEVEQEETCESGGCKL